MSDPIYYDTETCGFHGPIVLIQWAEGDGPIQLHETWTTPIYETMKLIEKIITHPGGVVGFNLTFDHFHLCQMYTTLLLMPDTQAYLEDCIEQYATLEADARQGPCLKPVKACDLMLHARKGPYQSTMNRGDIRIRRIPTSIAWLLAQELEKKVKLDDIYFAKRKNKFAEKWHVYDITNSDGLVDPDFKDIVLKFAPSSALKALAIDALKLPVDATLLFADIDIDSSYHPEELGYAPFAQAVNASKRQIVGGRSTKEWRGAWPENIKYHIRHWAYHKLARKYAEKDVEYTRALYKHFGSPELGDNDSELACMVGAVRWKGFRVDVEGLKTLRQDALKRKGKYPIAPEPSRRYVQEVMDATEKLVMRGSTKKTILEEIASWDNLPCANCDGKGRVELSPTQLDPVPTNAEELFAFFNQPTEISSEGEPCPACGGKGSIKHQAAERATQVLDARKAGKELELYDKLIIAGRLHADFVVIGTLSSRMAGAGGLNAQGIKRDKKVRQKFPLIDPGFVLCGGDFAGFEVVLAEACYNDPDLRHDLQSGKKIHALFGQFVYPHMTYEQILDDKEIYTRCKSAVFAMLYGGEAQTLKDRLGVPIETAEKAYEQFGRRYPGVAVARKKIIEMFSALRQPRGIGTAIDWVEPAEYVESMLGFRRYFTLENKIIRALFELGQSPPKEWRNIKVKVVRRDREQTAMGATQSALYGAAFALQASNIRAAANHVIQSSGAQVTKEVQRRIWDLQPSGIHNWIVQPMNAHDEIMCPTRPDYVDELKQIVDAAVEGFRAKVPLIEMEWGKALTSWADK